MTAPLLRTQDLTVRFGGLVAVNKVSFDVQRGEVFTIIGPNGAGKTTVFNLISRIYQPTAGSIHYEGQDLVARPPHAVAAMGIARTFQNIELFEFASVLQNLLIGTHTAAPGCGATCCSPGRRAAPRSMRATRPRR
jgi:branched-chain amino acid transport system ATP-binding protein